MNYLKKKLIENNIHCYDWRELFENVHDSEHIALLPGLSKKIPTFDFALIFAEDSIHIPDNFIGVGKLGVKHISYVSSDFDLSVDQLSCLLTKLNNNKHQ
ncbi:MAG: hypothetical protein IJA87_07300 [Clostridia bacterium]|nr:hypothetical protein [Clostridia bacterium]